MDSTTGPFLEIKRHLPENLQSINTSKLDWLNSKNRRRITQPKFSNLSSQKQVNCIIYSLKQTNSQCSGVFEKYTHKIENNSIFLSSEALSEAKLATNSKNWAQWRCIYGATESYQEWVKWLRRVVKTTITKSTLTLRYDIRNFSVCFLSRITKITDFQEM